jgi:DNA-binding NarL/FixJ family response regulator
MTRTWCAAGPEDQQGSRPDDAIHMCAHGQPSASTITDLGKTKTKGRPVMSDDPLEADCRKILVAGNCILRRGIASVVRDVVPSASIVEASCLSDAKARLGSDEFFAAIFDIDAGDLNGPINFRMLHANHPRLVLGVLSRSDNAGVILSYLAEGVNGYILGSATQWEIECAIRAILGRAIYIPPSVTGSNPAQADQALAVPPLRRNMRALTGRQSAVLKLLLNRYSNKEIARELDLSPHTVKIHVSALLRHFAVPKRMDLAIAAS